MDRFEVLASNVLDNYLVETQNIVNENKICQKIMLFPKIVYIDSQKITVTQLSYKI